MQKLRNSQNSYNETLKVTHKTSLSAIDACKNITHTSQAIKFEIKNYNIDGSLLSAKVVVVDENGYGKFHGLKNCVAISM